MTVDIIFSHYSHVHTCYSIIELYIRATHESTPTILRFSTEALVLLLPQVLSKGLEFPAIQRPGICHLASEQWMFWAESREVVKSGWCPMEPRKLVVRHSDWGIARLWTKPT